MRYAAVHRSWLAGDPAALDAGDAALGAWLRLAVHAADLELGEGDDEAAEGRIPGCKGWSDRAWLRAVGTDQDAVAEVVAAGLARWDGEDLLVSGYDLKGQRVIEAKREGGKKGGRPRKQPPKNLSDNHSKTTANGSPEPEVEESKTGSKPLSFPFPSSPSLSAVGAAAPDVVTAADACREYSDASTHTYPLTANRDAFGAIATQANDYPDPPRLLREVTRYFWRPDGWAQKDGRARPASLANGFHREVKEMRGEVAKPEVSTAAYHRPAEPLPDAEAAPCPADLRRP